jgi:hypothetical protein
MEQAENKRFTKSIAVKLIAIAQVIHSKEVQTNIYLTCYGNIFPRRLACVALNKVI